MPRSKGQNKEKDKNEKLTPNSGAPDCLGKKE
jgi:hypothetical protein